VDNVALALEVGPLIVSMAGQMCQARSEAPHRNGTPELPFPPLSLTVYSVPS
jgi:hypothetical protein